MDVLTPISFKKPHWEALSPETAIDEHHVVCGPAERLLGHVCFESQDMVQVNSKMQSHLETNGMPAELEKIRPLVV